MDRRKAVVDLKRLRTVSDMKRMQETNRVTVLRVLLDRAPLSRVALAKETHLSTPTISRIVKELIQEGLVVEAGKEEAALGRSPTLLRLATERLGILGLEITSSAVRGMLVSLHGESRAARNVQLSDSGTSAVSCACERIVRDLAASVPDQGSILGIGVSVPGVVSAANDIILFSDTLGWKQVAVQDLLPSFADYNIFAENDANSAILGERWLGRGQDRQHFVFISVGEGIGASVVYAGAVIAGHHGLAGELSHMPLIPGGRRCTCGRSGCLEMYVLRKHVQKAFRDSSGSGDVLKQFLRGDAQALAVVQEVTDALAHVIVLYSVMINPEHIFLGGTWVEAGNEFLAMVQSRAADLYPLENRSLPGISFSSLYPEAGVMGAAGLVMNRYLAYAW